MTPGVEGPPGPARYVYCITSGCERVALGPIGIERAAVYTVAVKDICVLVHDCVPMPYWSDGGDIATSWVLAHHGVVETAWKRWGAVLPMVFNTIISNEHGGAEEALVAWVEGQFESLKSRLEALDGKAEYVVQVFWDPALHARDLAQSSPKIAGLLRAIGSSPRGLAYMLRQQLEGALKEGIEASAAEQSRGLYSGLSQSVDAIKIERTKNGEPQAQMLLNVSCLVGRRRFTDLRAAVDRITSEAGLSVRLAGPLPPYSFC